VGIIQNDSGAAFSACRRWRYLLWRCWDRAGPVANFLMLNPSTADEAKLDPTCARARAYAERSLAVKAAWDEALAATGGEVDAAEACLRAAARLFGGV